jgi:hypothetical protein
MRFKPVFALCAALMLAGSALADAIPMPVELTAEQKMLVGVWQEEKAVMPTGLGHSFTLRTIAFGNTDLTLLTFGGISYSNDYGTNAMRGTWTASRPDKTTIAVTLDQGEGRAKILTIVFDGADRFTLSDSEQGYLPPSIFHRVLPQRPE